MPIFRDFRPFQQAVATLWGRYAKWAPRDPKHTHYRLLKCRFDFWNAHFRPGGPVSENTLKNAILRLKTHFFYYFVLWWPLWGWKWCFFFPKQLPRTIGFDSDPFWTDSLHFFSKVAQKFFLAKNPSHETCYSSPARLEIADPVKCLKIT